MKTILFLSMAIFANIASASGANVIGCNELEVLANSKLEDVDTNVRAQSLTAVQDAYQVFCREQHKDGETVFYPNGQLATAKFNTPGEQMFYSNSAIMMEQNDQGDSMWYLPHGTALIDGRDEISSLLFGEERQIAKIEAPFKAQHAKCAPGCSYISLGIWGDNAHKHRRSCHNSGEAIDIHGIVCGGTTSAALSKRFDSYVSCMRGKFTVIYRVKDHFNHAHIQIPHCKMIKLL